MTRWQNDGWRPEEPALPEFWEEWFHPDQLVLVGFDALDDADQEIVVEIFRADLTDVVAAMWHAGDILKGTALVARMNNFPLLRVRAALAWLDQMDDEDRGRAVQAIAMLRNIGLAEKQNGERS